MYPSVTQKRTDMNIEKKLAILFFVSSEQRVSEHHI